MKKTALLFLPLLVFLTACSKETPLSGDDSSSRQVNIRLSTQPHTRAGGDETIRSVEILVFDGRDVDPDDAKFQYRRYAWKKSDDTYNTILMVGEGLDLYFAVNAGSLVNNAPLVKDVTTWGEVRRLLVMDKPNETKVDSLPMWGYRHDVSLTDKDNNSLDIQLMRSVATAVVDVTAPYFKLDTAYIAYGIDRGYLAFDPANTHTVDGVLRIKGPQVPAGAGVVATSVWKTEPTDYNKVQNVLYLYENDYTSEPDPLGPALVGRQHTKVILAGRWAGNQEQITYYPLSFRNQQTGDKVPIARNRKYSIRITNVNGDGYPTLEDAEKGEDLNINYEVIEWDDDWKDEEIVVDGTKYIALGASRNTGLKRTAVLHRNATSTDAVNLKTNIAPANISLSLQGDPNPDDAVVENDRFKVELVTDQEVVENNTTIYYCHLLFTAKQDFTTEDISRLTVSAGLSRIRLDMDVRQMDSSPEDWQNGGDNQQTLGEQ